MAVERKTKHIAVGIPLKMLGDPQKLLGSVKTHLGDYPLDSAPWRIIDRWASEPVFWPRIR